MKTALAVLAVAAPLTLATAGCGGGGEMAGTPTTSQPPMAEGEVEGGRTVIDIRDLQFQPDEATVPAGTTVVFTNSDQVSHTVTKDRGPGPQFDSGPIEPGGTFSQVLNDKGTVRIVDSQRPETKLTIEVE